MISERNRALVDTVIELLNPDGLQCSKNQLKKARKHIHSAILVLSAEERRRELRMHQLAQVREEVMRQRAETRQRNRPFGMMTNQEFRLLSAPWSAAELAAMFGITTTRIAAYRRKAQQCNIPDEVALQLFELVEKTKRENSDMLTMNKQSRIRKILPAMSRLEFIERTSGLTAAKVAGLIGVPVSRIYNWRSPGNPSPISGSYAETIRRLFPFKENQPDLFGGNTE